MIRLRADGSDVIAKHQQLRQRIVAEREAAMPQAGETIVNEIREDLRGKILRPRESHGVISSAITYEVIKQAHCTTIGVGNISKMNKQAPHWRLQDEGGPIAVKAVPGYFVDHSGVRVPFDIDRAPKGPSSPSYDLFIYQPLVGWLSAGEYRTFAEASEGGPWRTIMFITKPVDPKHYFRGGDMEARPKVYALFATALRRAFS